MTNSEKRYQRVIEATRLIGRNSGYLRQALRDVMITAWGTTMMVKPMQSIKDKRGRPIATTRLLHYSNTAEIAFKIAQGLYPADQEVCMGVSTAALTHDLGQGPFGHDGESALKFASEQNNGGARLHNIEGEMKILYRYKNKIKYAMYAGKIVEDEAKKRKISVAEMQNIIDSGKAPDIKARIEAKKEENEEIIEDAVKILAMAAGNHNGERGTANIKPNYNRSFSQFYDTSLKTYIDVREDKNMESCNIVDAIVKISDQISSITFDIIDGKRSGIEDEIYEGWAEPIAKVLEITEEEARKRLKGNNQELIKLVRELQGKLIESVVRSSSKNEINMDLAHLLYGVTDKNHQVEINGLRTFNMKEHTQYTSTAELEVLLNNTASELTDKLVKSILDKKGTFPSELNEIFRLSENSPIRKTKERNLIEKFRGNENVQEFYKYVTELSPGEYRMNKSIVNEREVQYFREIIERTLKRREDLIDNTATRSPRKSTEYLIEEYMLSPSYEAMIPGKGNKYSDEEVKGMIDRINAYLNANPIEGIQHLSLLVQRRKWKVGEIVPTKKIRMSTDHQIAARIAISYLNTLNDEKFVNLAYSLGIITEEELKKFRKPYVECSGKRNGQEGYQTTSMKYATKDYYSGSGKVTNGYNSIKNMWER